MAKKIKDTKELQDMDEVLKSALNTPAPKKGVSMLKKKLILLKVLQEHRAKQGKK